MPNRYLAPLLVLATSLFSMSAPGAENALALVPEDSFATPRFIVQPAYPASAPAIFEEVRVDVTGTVLADGKFKTSAVVAPPGQEMFAEVVADAIKFWLFVPAVDHDMCAPKDQAFATAVWFNGTPAGRTIEVAVPKRVPPGTPSSYTWTAVSDGGLGYPSGALRAGVEGSVEVLLKVNTEGDVETAVVRSSTPPGIFDQDVLRAARKTHVKWAKPAPDHPLCGIRIYDFCIHGSPTDVRYSGCKH